jgi:hypothetical protein
VNIAGSFVGVYVHDADELVGTAGLQFSKRAICGVRPVITSM